MVAAKISSVDSMKVTKFAHAFEEAGVLYSVIKFHVGRFNSKSPTFIAYEYGYMAFGAVFVLTIVLFVRGMPIKHQRSL